MAKGIVMENGKGKGVRVHSSLQGVQTGASVEGVGVHSFVGVRSSLLNIFSFFNKNILNNNKKS